MANMSDVKETKKKEKKKKKGNYYKGRIAGI